MTKATEKSRKERGLKLIAEAYGYGSVEDMLDDTNFMLDSVVPGICSECWTVEDSCEPDASRNWCSECEKRTVAAVTWIAEVV